MSVAERFRRHDWVWVGRGTRLPDLMEVRRHHEAGLPFVVCRNPTSTRKDQLWLGLALPDCRAHSPNENFPLENYRAGIRLNQALLGELAAAE